MKKICLTLLTCVSSWLLSAQVDVDVLGGASKSDQSFGSIRASWTGAQGLRLGAQYTRANYRYRFIDARPVRDGTATEARLLLSFPLVVESRVRLDAALHPGLRWIMAPTEPQEFTYDFTDASAFTLEPKLTVTFYPANKLAVYTGIDMRMAWQIQPEAIFEQFPSALLRAGAAYSLSDRISLFADFHSGPMAGASGDTEKYGWLAAVGLRFRFGADFRHVLHTGL